jgi:Uma2 family endonuclease
MFEKQSVCLANGGQEFWVVDPARRKVDVFTSAGRFSTYTPGEKIPLLFGGELFVDRIFD